MVEDLGEGPYVPKLYHVIQSYDTAFLKKETADFSAITTWGVFYPDPDSPAHLNLIRFFKERLEFPELKGSFRAIQILESRNGDRRS